METSAQRCFRFVPQNIDRDPPEPNEENRNKTEKQLAEEAGAPNPGLVLGETRYRRLTVKQAMRRARG
jgi:hypothetical protein